MMDFYDYIVSLNCKSVHDNSQCEIATRCNGLRVINGQVCEMHSSQSVLSLQGVKSSDSLVYTTYSEASVCSTHRSSTSATP